MRAEDDQHSVQAVVGENAPGTILARPDYSLCRAGHYWIGLVRQTTLPGED